MRALLACLMLVGCASANPNYFSLEREPGPALHGARRTVVVRNVVVPHYLERDEIVRKSQNGRLDVSGNNWWSEPLQQMLRRVLAADLSQRLPDAEVLGTELVAGEGAAVSVAVERFEPDGRGSLVLEGHLAILIGGQDRLLRRIAIEVPLPDGGTDAQVRAMSQALAQVADIAAATLAP